MRLARTGIKGNPNFLQLHQLHLVIKLAKLYIGYNGKQMDRL